MDERTRFERRRIGRGLRVDVGSVKAVRSIEWVPQSMSGRLYRPCVGVALVNRAGDAFIGHRKRKRGSEVLDPRSWQMPQGGIDAGRTTARSREARTLGGNQRPFDRTDRGAARVAQIRFAGRCARTMERPVPRADPEVVPVPVSSARIRKSTFTIRPAAPTMPNLTTGAGSVWSVCQSLWCPLSARSTKPLLPLSRRSRVPRDREPSSYSYFPALTEATAAAISSSIFLRRR